MLETGRRAYQRKEYDTMVYRKRENQKDGNGMVVPVMEPDGVDAL